MSGSKLFVPHSHVPYWEDGSGSYSDHNTACFQVNQAAIPLALDAVQSIVVPNGSVFTIVDYKTADGGVSMPLMYACVKAIRARYGEELPINVVYEDQPISDFKSLFMRLQGLIPGPRRFLQDFSNVYVMANGTSFYSQCLPRDSVTLGFSATAMHWLSEKPCDITNATMVHVPTADHKEKEKFCEQAARDWELILLNRAAELIPGGRMVLSPPTVDQDGNYPGNSDNPKGCDLHTVLGNLWKGLEHEGIITNDEFKATNFILYFRSLEEYKQPFKCKDSPVSQAGLELVSIETRLVRCPHHQRWMEKNGDPREHAKGLMASIRAWGYSTFMSGLSTSRSAEEKVKIVDKLYQRYEDVVAECPEYHQIDYISALIVIQKHLDI